MNELFFALHIFLMLGFLFWAIRWGQEALTALVALAGVLANLFVVKQVALFGLGASCSDVFAVGAILGLNLLQEYWGREAARRAAFISFFSLLFFLVMSQIHLLYNPLAGEGTHRAFATVLSHAPRIALSSAAVYFLVQKWDIAFFSWLKARASGRWLGLRVGCSLVVSQALDTALFTYFGLYGLVSFPFELMIVSFAIKCSVIAVSGPMTALAKKWVNRAPV